MKILVTGAAGFIGAALTLRLLARGDQVFGIDNLNDYYDVKLKLARLQRCEAQKNFTGAHADLQDRAALMDIFASFKPERVVNLAAQAGVRHSLKNPQAYIDSNITGFLNVLEACRHNPVEHLVYASSSSVYGANTKMPFSVSDNADHPVSLYGASKKANELMAYSYSHLFKIPSTGLRFFTVYGPWGRPDMALFDFTRKIQAGETIDIYNHGNHRRDFTYIDDIVEGVVRVVDRIPESDNVSGDSVSDAAVSNPPYRLYNIGNNRPVELLRFIEVLEDCLGKKAVKNFLPMQAGDVVATYADVDDLVRDVNYKPDTSIEQGVARFVDWYRNYYRV